jgi:RNA polymerase sigma factor (sigma-70 family)
MRRAKRLTADEEQALARRVATGDEAAVHQLIERNEALVVKSAERFVRPGVDVEELIAAGNLGLVIAARAYRPDSGARFATFALFWIRGKMAAEARGGVIQVPELLERMVAEWESMAAALGNRNGRAPKDDEVSAALGLDTDRAEDIAHAMRARIVDTLEPTTVAPEETTVDAEERERVRRMLRRLKPIERRVVRYTFGFGVRPISHEELAERLGMARTTVWRIHTNALRKLRHAAGVA